MSDTNIAQIQLNSQAPLSISGETGSTTFHNLKDQIELDRYVKSQAATARSGQPYRVKRQRFGNAAGVDYTLE